MSVTRDLVRCVCLIKYAPCFPQKWETPPIFSEPSKHVANQKNAPLHALPRPFHPPKNELDLTPIWQSSNPYAPLD